MNTFIKISLDTRRVKKNGSCPIILRITHNSKRTTSITTGYSVPMKFWDVKKACIKPNYKGYGNITRINNHIEKQKAKSIDILAKLHEKNELRYMSIQDVKQRVSGRAKNQSFFKFTEKLIRGLFEEDRLGTARSYKNVLNQVKKFQRGNDFSFNELNYQFLLSFEHNFMSRGFNENGLAVYMRTIRAIYNKAIKEGFAELEAYPFKKYTIKTKPTKKRAIGYDAIQKIVNLSFKPADPLYHTRNMFLMSFYLQGAPFMDLAFLRVSNLIDGRVQYKRRKTGRFYDIKITPSLYTILKYYLEGKKVEDFILPIIKRESLIDRYNDVQWAHKRYNLRLKEVAKLAGIDENLTSYVSRHSFASIANNLGVPVTAISEMLGHEKLSTTQIYLARLKKDVLDQYNEQVIGGG